MAKRKTKKEKNIIETTNESKDTKTTNESKDTEIVDESKDTKTTNESKDTEIVDESKDTKTTNESKDNVSTNESKNTKINFEDIKKDLAKKSLDEYISRYLKSIEKNNRKQAITNFYHIYYIIEKYPSFINEVIKFFSKNQILLGEHVVLQYIDTLNKKASLRLSIFYHVINTIIRYPKDKSKISLNIVRDIIPKDLYNTYIKLLKK